MSIIYIIGRKIIFPDTLGFEDLSEDEQKIWKHFVDNYKIPSQIRIVQIIQENSHLIYEQDVIPECIQIFLDYALGWELLDNQSKSKVPNYYQYVYSFNFPNDFDTYIKSTLAKLNNEKSELINKEEASYIKKDYY